MRNKYRPLIGYRNTRKKCKTREGTRRRKTDPTHPPCGFRTPKENIRGETSWKNNMHRMVKNAI